MDIRLAGSIFRERAFLDFQQILDQPNRQISKLAKLRTQNPHIFNLIISYLEPATLLKLTQLDRPTRDAVIHNLEFKKKLLIYKEITLNRLCDQLAIKAAQEQQKSTLPSLISPARTVPAAEDLIKVMFPLSRTMAKKNRTGMSRFSEQFSPSEYEALLEMRRNKNAAKQEIRGDLEDFVEFNQREKDLIQSICAPDSHKAVVLDNYISYNVYRTFKKTKYLWKTLNGQNLKPHEVDELDFSSSHTDAVVSRIGLQPLINSGIPMVSELAEDLDDYLLERRLLNNELQRAYLKERRG